MARTTSNTTKTNNGEETAPPVKEEQTSLEQQVSELAALVQSLLKQNQELKTQTEKNSEDVSKSTTNSIFESTEQRLDIDPREYVRIISLTNGGLNLQGLNSVVRLSDFGSSKLVTFEDVRAMVDNHPRLAHEGGFLIQSEKAVKALYLDDVYQKFISKESIDNLFKFDAEKIIETLESVTPTLKTNIIERIVACVADEDPKYQDRNKLRAITEYIGKDIYDLAKELNN
ncbi:hypothetical protein F4V43_02530 [Paenibacillus spiritus]|uniref:Uncharacterized protein n=1 Tax=Paenibacillus spiritus TaxID=2496557 RepID=A0A5J5GI49_9BACL|nr:hypothetical protein [Paenibacillus spiritus]KAA9007383.1 hypothetical protein F4V43_02530 [Paenibacillus spiritus]